MRARLGLLTLLAAAVIATGCDESPVSPTEPLRDEFVLAPGGSTTLSDGSARITFQGVIGDSRCPADALCILGGDAIVRIDVTSTRRTQTHDLRTGNMAPVAHDDLTIALVELSPYPFSARPITPDEYRASFRVTRNAR